MQKIYNNIYALAQYITIHRCIEVYIIEDITMYEHNTLS